MQQAPPTEHQRPPQASSPAAIQPKLYATVVEQVELEVPSREEADKRKGEGKHGSMRRSSIGDHVCQADFWHHDGMQASQALHPPQGQHTPAAPHELPLSLFLCEDVVAAALHDGSPAGQDAIAHITHKLHTRGECCGFG